MRGKILFNIKSKVINDETTQLFSCIIALVVLVVTFSILSPYFFTADNLLSVLMQTTTTALLGIGSLYVIIGQAVDLSVGPVLAMCSVMVATFLANNWPVWLSCTITLFCGLLLGLLNGLLITKMELTPFVATIGTQMVIRGMALVITDSRAVYISKRPEFRVLGQGRFLGIIQYPVIIMFVLAVIAAFILKKPVIGRHVYALGSNEEAARLSGIHTHGIRIFTYMVSAGMAAVAGILVTARVNSGQPSIGIAYEADAIAACVIGGASMNGGRGTVVGTLMGACIIGILTNGLNLIGISTNWQQVTTGCVLIIAVFVDVLRQRKRKKAK